MGKRANFCCSFHKPAYSRRWVGRTQQPTLIRLVAWSPGGEQLISGGSDGRLRW